LILVIILTNNTFALIPEGGIHTVLTAGPDPFGRLSFSFSLTFAVITGFHYARAEGRKKESLRVLSWDIERIRFHLAQNDATLSGLEALHQDCVDLDAEVKLVQAVPGSTVAEKQTLQSYKERIRKTIQEIGENKEKEMGRMVAETRAFKGSMKKTGGSMKKAGNIKKSNGMARKMRLTAVIEFSHL
jgi:hypothetical protein